MITELDAIGASRVAAVLLEPVAGLSGIRLPDHYLRELREYRDRHGILVIFDEVFSGMGRMGPMFAAEFSGVSPDLLCLSKALIAGYAPLSAVLATDAVYQAFDAPMAYFAAASSTDAHPISCAAGAQTLRALTEGSELEQGVAVGQRLGSLLTAELASQPLVEQIRVIGPYVAIDVKTPRISWR